MSALRAVSKMLDPVRRKVALLAGRAILNLVNDAEALQLVQASRLDDETTDDLERFGEYGLASNPPPGAEAVVMSIGGVRSHGIAIAVEHRQYRLKGLQSGEVALYDDQGQVVKLGRDGIEIVSTKPVNVTSTISIGIDAPDIQLKGDIQITGDLKVDGDSDLGGPAGKFVKLADNSNSTKVKA